MSFQLTSFIKLTCWPGDKRACHNLELDTTAHDEEDILRCHLSPRLGQLVSRRSFLLLPVLPITLITTPTQNILAITRTDWYLALVLLLSLDHSLIKIH